MLSNNWKSITKKDILHYYIYADPTSDIAPK